MKYQDFLAILDDRVLVCDGGTGTEFYNRGVFINHCYDSLNIDCPGLVKQVHRDYVEAGAQIIETNTFSANRFKLRPHGLAGELARINREGVVLARSAAGENALVAGAVGPLGLRIEPWGSTSVEEAEEAFSEQIRVLVDHGVDLFILETFSDLNEIHQAIKAVQKEAPGFPIVAQMTIGHDGNGLYGTSPETFTRRLEAWGAHVIGLNCSVGPETMLTAIEKMSGLTNSKLSAQPNAGVPRNVEGRNLYMATPEYLAEYAKRFIQSGVSLVGGCCGTTPRHIRAVVKAVKALSPGVRRFSRPGADGKAVSYAASSQPASTDRDGPEHDEMDIASKSAFGRKLAQGQFVVTLELTPPRGINPKRQVEGAKRLKEWGVDAINIPDGPRASARMSPLALALILEREVGIETILHYCCRDRNLLGMQSDLMGAAALGLHNLLIITGDPPKLGDYPDATAVFDIDSIGLTNVVHRLNQGLDLGENSIGAPTGFLIGVGANPGAIDLETEIRRFRYKVEAGAEFAITQPVFDIEQLNIFLDMIDDFRIPIIAGIWPLTSLRNAQFMNNEVPGAHVPDEFLARLEACRTKQEARAEGLTIAKEMLEAVKTFVQGVQISVPFGRTKPLEELLETAKQK